MPCARAHHPPGGEPAAHPPAAGDAAAAHPSAAGGAAHAVAAPHRSWWLLALLCAAQFMVILDVTVVNVALPSIGADLGVRADELQWVVTAYVLATGGLMLLGGRAADRVGARPLLLAGLALFTAASAASGLAPSAGALIAARAAQGVGAALLVPAALAAIATTYAGRQRTVALAVWGAIGSAGAAAGVLVGGVLTTLLGWEAIFWVNVPIGLAALAGLARMLPRGVPAAAAGARLDLAGAATLLGGLVALAYALEGVAEHGWGAGRTLLPLAGGLLLLALFALVERRVAAPLVPPASWRTRSLVAGAAVMLGATGLLVGSFFLNTLYLQRVLDASALETGLAFLPLALAILLAAHAAGRLLPRLGARTLVLGGLTLTAAGCGLLALAPDRADYLADLLPAFVVLGLGVGLVFVAVSVAAMADVDHAEAGLASGLMTTAHELGAALGVALLAAVAFAADGFAVGYERGFAVAAALAVALALLSALALPAVRPAPGMRAALH